MDVGVWLRSLGLGRYEVAFSDNSIDADVLPDLTDGDLAQLGVNLGDRKRLLKAIASLAATEPAAKLTSLAPLPLSTDAAERRPITVMFCDLVGSTSLAAKLDAEDWRNLVNAYLDEASKAVTVFGGHVLKKLGDGLMALFGYPQAQENDAERAVRAALVIQRALSDLNARHLAKGAPELSARIGLESGPVVVEAAGEVFGDAPNVAARVQAEAEPGSVLITLNVQRQVAGLFVVEEQSTRELKGVSRPVQLFRIVRASGGGRRGGTRTLTPFVGREEELGLLTRRWERARAGEGQLVLVVGEPGLGKSRLIEEFHSQLAETPHTWSEWSASQLLQNTPLHPIAEWGRLRFGADAPAEQRLADLEGTLRLTGLDPAEHASLLAPLVDIPLPPDRATNLPPEELRRRQLAAMTAWVLAGARSQPLVLAFEDLHWADPTSLDLLRAFADRGAQAPLLVLATTRPEFHAPWSLRSHHSLISLSPLDRAGVARMVGEISARHALSKELIEGVNERTGGVPLFVEEVTRLLVERGAQGGVQAIPPTLQQSLAARLDRLGPAREVAQIGAVLGRDFVYGLLRDVAEIEEQALQASLDRLAEADLLFVEGAPPQAKYRFKHALIQDAAYESLLKSRRQALHRRAAEALLSANAEPEAIAHHFTEAGLDDAAIKWWGRAGDQALRRSAFQEAIAHLGKAIAMSDKAAGAAQRRADAAASSRRRLKLQTDYGQAMMWSKGFAAEETKTAFVRAAELAARTDDFSERFAACHGQWTVETVRGELRSARELASTFLREAQDAGRVVETGVAHRGLALIGYFSGEFLDSQTHCERALEACTPGHEEKARERFGEYTGTLVMSCLAITTWQLGEVARARELIDTANQRATEIGHVPSIANPLYFKSLLEILRGDASATLAASNALRTLSGEHGMTLQRIWAEVTASWAYGRLHDPHAGADRLERALAAYAEQGAILNTRFYKALLAQLEAEASGAQNALNCVDEALAQADQSGDRWDLAFTHRLRGDILLKCDPSNAAPAEDAFKTAIAIAEEQGARSLRLQAALALSKLYQSISRPADAHAVLAPALEGFAPTPEMPEIAEAQALLATLAESDEVKGATERHRRRLDLQTSYGQALLWARGFTAEETRAAFARVDEIVGPSNDLATRIAICDAQCLRSFMRGEYREAREIAETLLREAGAEARGTEVGTVRRMLGLVHLYQGNLKEAQSILEREATEFQLGPAGHVTAAAFLALTEWHLGEIERARQSIERAIQRADETVDAASIGTVLFFRTVLESRRDDVSATRVAADALLRVSEQYGMKTYSDQGKVYANWARGRLLDPVFGAKELEQALTAYTAEGNRADAPSLYGLLAELEASESGPERSLPSIERGLAIADETGEHFTDPYLHRLRGELLLKRNPSEPAPVEEAFKAAIAAAKVQGARSYELLASLSLAKLYQSTDRPADAHAVLAPALEGFAPTPEMPEIAEAQALLVAIEAGAHVRHE